MAAIAENLDMLNVILTIPAEEQWHMRRVGILINNLMEVLMQRREYEKYTKLFHLFMNVSFYHDIGKAWVAPEVLMKAERLTEREYEQILLHPVYAQKYFESHFDLFSDCFILRRIVYNSAVFHHERWDGCGYPYGLKREQIPLTARITSVCDTYDAITNNRPYCRARSHAAACAEIERCAGEQFDPVIAEVFCDSLSVSEADRDLYNMT